MIALPKWLGLKHNSGLTATCYNAPCLRTCNLEQRGPNGRRLPSYNSFLLRRQQYDLQYECRYSSRPNSAGKWRVLALLTHASIGKNVVGNLQSVTHVACLDCTILRSGLPTINLFALAHYMWTIWINRDGDWPEYATLFSDSQCLGRRRSP
jgi:hypothetical protein